MSIPAIGQERDLRPRMLGLVRDEDVLRDVKPLRCGEEGVETGGTPIPPSVRGDVSEAEAIDVVQQLVATPSVSGQEREAVALFASLATNLGLSAEIDDAGNGVALRAGVPDGAGRLCEIVLLGHIDTVPGEIPVRIEDGVLHGRGSVDAKGPLAAMLVAAATADLPAGVAVRVCAAVGEETPLSPGARFLSTRLRPAACIIGEPSGWDGVTLGYKGTLVIHASAERANAHGAGPGESAPDMLHAWWGRVLTALAELNHGRVGIFETIQHTIRRMGSFNDGLTESASMTVGFRLPPWMNPHRLERWIRQRTNEPVRLNAEGHERAIRSERTDAAAQALSVAIREEGGRPRPKVKTGTADMNVVGPVWRCPIVAYGPGDSELDHTPVERLEIGEYLRSIRVLARGIGLLARQIADGVLEQE